LDRRRPRRPGWHPARGCNGQPRDGSEARVRQPSSRYIYGYSPAQPFSHPSRLSPFGACRSTLGRLLATKRRRSRLSPGRGDRLKRAWMRHAIEPALGTTSTASIATATNGSCASGMATARRTTRSSGDPAAGPRRPEPRRARATLTGSHDLEHVNRPIAQGPDDDRNEVRRRVPATRIRR
jgi:hypothetical protein